MLRIARLARLGLTVGTAAALAIGLTSTAQAAQGRIRYFSASGQEFQIVNPPTQGGVYPPSKERRMSCSAIRGARVSSRSISVSTWFTCGRTCARNAALQLSSEYGQSR